MLNDNSQRCFKWGLPATAGSVCNCNVQELAAATICTSPPGAAAFEIGRLQRRQP